MPVLISGDYKTFFRYNLNKQNYLFNESNTTADCIERIF